MTTTTSREIRLKRYPTGVPTDADFEMATVELPPPADGDVLVKNLWMSVDPYMRGRMTGQNTYVQGFALGRALEGAAVGQVVESRHPTLRAGDHVVNPLGWREGFVSNGRGLQVVDAGLAPVQAYLGVLGMPGMSAYVGLLRCGEPKPGDTVFVSGAAGAVGSAACQIAKIKGCRVIASAGSPDKVAWLHDAARVDAAFSYRDYKDAAGLVTALRERAPDGIDVYFDNVGGDHLEAALQSMKDFGRIVLCGSISRYNDATPPAGPAVALRGHAQAPHPARLHRVGSPRRAGGVPPRDGRMGAGQEGRVAGDGGRGPRQCSPGLRRALHRRQYRQDARADRARPRAHVDLGSHGGIMALPLDGISVIEFGQNLAGPFCAEILAHLGADVVKVERPGAGDDARGWGPPFGHGTSAAFHSMNVNKRSIAVDLKDAAAVARLRGLVGRADVLVQNMRPGSMDELGLGADSLRAEFPRLIYCSLWAFGRTGPRSLQPGYEPMVQAFSSLMWLSGDEDDPPTRMGTSVLDFGTGMWAAMGVLAALEQRHRTGQGCVVDTSLFETALSWLTGHFASFRLSGELPTRHRTGSRRLVIFQGFETKNGPVVVAAGNDRLFAKLAEVLGHPEWAVDPRFATNPERVKHREVLVPMIETIMLTRTKGEWVDLLESVGVPCAPVNTLHEVLADPQTEAIGMIQKSPEHGLELMSLPISFDGARPPLRRRAPTVGEHNAEILPG